MPITLDGTNGITNDGGYTGDGVVFADTTPANTLVTTTGGNVGIGTSSPGAKLEVAGATRTYSRAANGGPNNTTGNNIWWYIGSIRLGDSESATLRMDGTQSYGAGGGIAGCTYLHLRGDNGNGISGYFYGTSSGETGIQSIAYKATAISEQFDLWVRIAEFASAVVYCDTNGVYAPASTGTGSATQPSGSTLFTSVWTFTTGGVERARIDASGVLRVNNTSGGNGWVTSLGDASRAGFSARVASNGQWGAAWHNASDVNVGTIVINSTSTAYNTSSDYRLKENIQPMTGALAAVQQLKPCTYNWKADGSDGQGFIAHELAEVVPQCVTGEKDAVDAEGKPIYQGIDTSFLTATLTAAIQEQQAIITALTARVAALESQP